MIGKSLTLLEMGIGGEFKRACKTAREHPDWHVIAIDPEIREGAPSPLPNLTLIHGKFPHTPVCKGDIKIDRVEMYHMGHLFAFSGEGIAVPTYAWMNDYNPWLAKKHEICIIDNTLTRHYHQNRGSFMRLFEVFKKIFERKGYEVKLEEVPKKDFEIVTQWDKIFYPSWPCHARIHLIKN